MRASDTYSPILRRALFLPVAAFSITTVAGGFWDSAATGHTVHLPLVLRNVQ